MIQNKEKYKIKIKKEKEKNFTRKFTKNFRIKFN